jgi:uncharacterized Ntn-hydrolase superfamily protein
MTFSIIGIDYEHKMIGGAVASKWTSVGSCVPYFRPGVGLVHVQNHSCAQVAHRILDEMAKGQPLEVCMKHALVHDTAKEKRQCLAVSQKTGELYVTSPKACSDISHQKIGKFCVVAGNTITSKNVVENMVTTFDENREKLLSERLLLSLEAGQAAGGDARGQEAASLRVFKFDYPEQRFFPIDLRVDSHDAPLDELRRLHQVWHKGERRVIR